LQDKGNARLFAEPRPSCRAACSTTSLSSQAVRVVFRREHPSVSFAWWSIASLMFALRCSGHVAPQALFAPQAGVRLCSAICSTSGNSRRPRTLSSRSRQYCIGGLAIAASAASAHRGSTKVRKNSSLARVYRKMRTRAASPDSESAGSGVAEIFDETLDDATKAASDPSDDGQGSPPTGWDPGSEEDQEESSARVAHSLELLSDYSEEAHPGHQPGRFAGMGPEFDGMEFDGLRWHLKKDRIENSSGSTSSALAKLSDSDRVLATKFESSGGLALCLSNAFSMPDELRSHAREMLRNMDSGSTIGQPNEDTMAQIQQAMTMLQTADMAEEKEAVMRNVWSDVEFHEGELGNAELVNRLEMQFASQLMRTAETHINNNKVKKRRRHEEQTQQPEEHLKVDDSHGETGSKDSHQDGVFEVVLRGCSDATDLAQSLPTYELTKILKEPRNLVVALDLVGVYLKNYEIDKADLVLERVVPLCRERGGPWLVKALDKLSLVRMKQFKAYEALIALKEIEKLVPFTPEEGWEFHDILYRNLAWCYSALDEAERCLKYTRESVEVKRKSGIAASWFDIWDLGKSHARLGQKKQQREEMQVGYDLCVKAGEIHRKAEPQDRIMLAKILSNVGEVAMGIGDSHFLEGDRATAREWYEKAAPSLEEAYELHFTALGPMKPLSGWQAGTMAHCLVRLEKWESARDYLALALKVECTKDSTTPGSLIELIDRVMNVYHELGDMKAMAVHLDELDQGLSGLRGRGWDLRERDVFALLLHKVATVFLLADGGTGKNALRASKILKEAETNLVIYLGAAKGEGAFQCGTCGKLYTSDEDLEPI